MNRSIRCALLGCAIAVLAALPAFAQDTADKRIAIPDGEGGSRTLQVYDVRDLVAPDDAPEGMVPATVDHFCEMVRTHVEPAFDPDHESVKSISPGALVLVGLPEQHLWVRDFLELQRRNTQVYFMMDVKILTLKDRAYEKLIRGTKPEVLDDAGKDDFLGRVSKYEGSETLSAPRVLSLNGQKVSISIENRLKYIKGYELVENVLPGDQTVEVPEIETISEGMVIEGRATLIADDKIGVQFELTLTEVQRPIQTVATSYGEIALPEVMKSKIESKLYLADGASALFPGQPAEDRNLVILLTVSRP